MLGRLMGKEKTLLLKDFTKLKNIFSNLIISIYWNIVKVGQVLIDFVCNFCQSMTKRLFECSKNGQSHLESYLNPI